MMYYYFAEFPGLAGISWVACCCIRIWVTHAAACTWDFAAGGMSRAAVPTCLAVSWLSAGVCLCFPLPGFSFSQTSLCMWVLPVDGTPVQVSLHASSFKVSKGLDL